MQSIAWGVLDVALSNAAVAAAAAVLVWIASRIWRKPALSHALWLIVTTAHQPRDRATPAARE